MKIRRVILEGVNNFVQHFDYSFEDEWTRQVPDALLLIGPNGSGKTTLLNVMAGLWELFGRWLGSLDHEFVPRLPAFIPVNCRWVAMELVELGDDQPLWIFHTPVEPTNWADLRWIVAQQETHRIGTTWADQRKRTLVPHYFPPGATAPVLYDPRASDSRWNWILEWWQNRTDTLLGKHKDVPNLVFIEGDERRVLKIEEPFEVVREVLDEFRWLVRYEPTDRRKGSLENYLFNLSAIDKPAFDRVLEQVNAFLFDKRITGFDPITSALRVEVNGRGRHTVDQLSSGEKQVLLMITFITRWLRPGGIVLIDEPDLHLHVSWVNALVSHLRRMIAEQHGQLIIASHEPSLWKHFTESHQVWLGHLDAVQR
jgi:ABC-type transport system involved in cytochrome c biogenesis ATPase subunit